MDDLVVIILTLIVAVIGIIGQTKKRKTTGQPPQTQTGKSPQNFWDMLESQMDPEMQSVEMDPDFPEEDEQVDVVPETIEYKFEAINEGISEFKEIDDQEIQVNDTSKAKKEKFPLKKAVIYSEILNRKYI